MLSIRSQKARPIRHNELFTAYGIDGERMNRLLGETTEWRNTFKRLMEIAPVQTWEPLLTALFTAELGMATEATGKLYLNSNRKHLRNT
jgi:hypothetical protein